MAGAEDKGLIELIQDISERDNEELRNHFLTALADAKGDTAKGSEVHDVIKEDYSLVTVEDCQKMILAFQNFISQMAVTVQY